MPCKPLFDTLLPESLLILCFQVGIDLCALGGFVAMQLGLDGSVQNIHQICEKVHTGSVGSFLLSSACSFTGCSFFRSRCSSRPRRLAIDLSSSGRYQHHREIKKRERADILESLGLWLWFWPSLNLSLSWISALESTRWSLASYSCREPTLD